MLAALRESVVLYAGMMVTGCPPTYEYLWAVDPGLARQAQRFIDCFNGLFSRALPPAAAEQAEAYYWAAGDNVIAGRCVRLGYDDRTVPVRHYHWAVRPELERAFGLQEFWDTEVWTTERYRNSIGLSDGGPPPWRRR